MNLTGPEFCLDLNGHSIMDFSSGWELRASGNLYTLHAYTVNIVGHMYYINNDLGGGASHGMPGSIAPLNNGTLIGSAAPQDLLWSWNSNDGMMWNEHDFYAIPMDTYYGIWHDTPGKYLGFKIIDESDTFYGWMQFDTDSRNNITLIDYAYESTPNNAIQAGVSQAPMPASLYSLFSGLLFLS